MVTKFSVPRGTADILPSESVAWQRLEEKIYNILNIYNYREIRTPYFEETELFARSMGKTSDVVQKQMLNIASQKDAAELSGLSLRPEGTASVVRSYIQNSLDKKESLSKLFYFGPMFRGERPQKGRLRQFHQVGVEAIGPDTSSPYLDAEVISLAVYILKSLGLNGFKLKINTLGSAEDKEKFSGILRDLLQPHLSKLSEESQKRFDRNVFRILDSKSKEDQAIVNSLDFGDSYLSAESKEYYQNVQNALTDLGVEFEHEPKLVRGLDYYTHTVFEISDASLGSQDALGAGGRYAGLVSQLGGSAVDAIGFALGIERILLAQPTEEVEQVKPDVFVIALDQSAFPVAFRILQSIRNAHISADISYRVSSVKSQMRLANKVGAPRVVILGENEIQKEMITLKNMEEGSQEEVSIQGNDYSKLIDKLGNIEGK